MKFVDLRCSHVTIRQWEEGLRKVKKRLKVPGKSNQQNSLRRVSVLMWIVFIQANGMIFLPLSVKFI